MIRIRLLTALLLIVSYAAAGGSSFGEVATSNGSSVGEVTTSNGLSSAQSSTTAGEVRRAGYNVFSKKNCDPDYGDLDCSVAYTYEGSPNGDYTITLPAGCGCNFPLKAQYINKMKGHGPNTDDGVDYYKYEVHFVNQDCGKEFVLKARKGFKKVVQTPNTNGTVTFTDTGKRMIFFFFHSDPISLTQPNIPHEGPFTLVVYDGEVEYLGNSCSQRDPTKNDWACESSALVSVEGKFKLICDLLA